MIKISPRTLFLLIPCVGLLSSCMQIREKVFLNRDGSGTFALAVDLSQMINMLESLGGDPDEMEENPFDGLAEGFSAQKEALNALEGIDNARIERDDDASSVTVLFDFEDIDALNAGANLVFGPGADGSDGIVFYRYSGNRFERTSYFDHARQIKTDLENSDDMNGMDLDMIFRDMSYTTEFEFEAPVKTMSNEAASLSADNRTVTFEYFFFREESEGTSVENVVKL